MFKIQSVEITGFWQTHSVSATFHDDVNIIIGENGTGKTTFINIVYAVLAVDIQALYENYFKSVTLKLSDGEKTRTIRATRSEDNDIQFPMIKYHISNRRFDIPIFPDEDIRSISFSVRRRFSEEHQLIKQELSKIVSVSSLSVYRIGNEPDSDPRERISRKSTSTVDVRLLSLMQQLTQYQLELSNEARQISIDLQRDVLTSLLYKREKSQQRIQGIEGFDEVTEKKNLISTYQQLGVKGNEVERKIQEHISTVGSEIRNLQKVFDSKTRGSDVKINGAALEAFKLTRTIVDKSLIAERKIKSIFTQIELFLAKLKEFIKGKNFTFVNGEFTVNSNGVSSLTKLSSGEKQLLILFIEALLQRKKPFIFIADEPELSLHIAWQRNILSAIREINPMAQIAVATHSPEIAGTFRQCLLHMEKILHG